jgi:hypothetical protein
MGRFLGFSIGVSPDEVDRRDQDTLSRTKHMKEGAVSP